jgi:hypothetical protein
MTPRITVDWVSRWMMTARPSASTVCTPMLITTYSNVTRSAFQNSGSCHSLTKFLVPIQRGEVSRS